MIWFLLWIGVNFLIGYAIGKPKDQALSSALICVLIGPLGWMICAEYVIPISATDLK